MTLDAKMGFWWLKTSLKNPTANLWLAFLALALAGTLVIAILAISERLQHSITLTAAEGLAADLALDSAEIEPPFELVQDVVAQYQAQTATTLEMRSMIYFEDQSVLGSLKAVDDQYPLKGELLLQPDQATPARATKLVPGSNEVWVDQRLLDLLQAQVGDSIEIGEADFRIAGILNREPDRVNSANGLYPRVMLSLSEMASTELLAAGSRLRWRQLISTDADDVTTAAFVEQIQQRLASISKAGDSLLRLRLPGEGAAGSIQKNASSFLLVAGWLAISIALLAGHMALSAYGQSLTMAFALMRALGASTREIMVVIYICAAVIGNAAFIAASVGGYGVQQFLANYIEREGAIELGGVSVWPWLYGGIAQALALIFSFTGQQRGLLSVDPVQLLRSQQPTLSETRSKWLQWVLAFAALSAVMYFYTDSLSLVGGYWLAIFLSLLLLGGLVYSLMPAIYRLLGAKVFGRAGRVAAVSWIANKGNIMTQAAGLSLVLLPALLMLALQTTLLTSWTDLIPDDEPNYIAADIPNSQVVSFTEQLGQLPNTELGTGAAVASTIMVASCEIAGDGNWFADDCENGEPSIARTVNFSSSEQIPDGNTITAGSWWDEDALWQLSIEEEFSQDSGLELGDRVSLNTNVGVQEFQVTSIRQVDWLLMQPNFWILVPPAVLEHMSLRHMQSFRIQPEQEKDLYVLLRSFPSVTLFDLKSLIRELHYNISRLSAMMQLMLAATILAAVFVVWQLAYQGYRNRRIYLALVKALGVNQTQVLYAELLLVVSVGVMAGLAAAAGADFIQWLLAKTVFELPRPSSVTELWWIGPLSGLVLTLISTASFAWRSREIGPQRVLQGDN